MSPNRSHGRAATVKTTFPPGRALQRQALAVARPLVASLRAGWSRELAAAQSRGRDVTNLGPVLASWHLKGLAAPILQLLLLRPGMEAAVGRFHLVLAKK